MAEKDATERRVYNLPIDLLERLRAFQTEQGIASEAEAARRLLDSALQMRDSIGNILNTLEAKFAEEKDLRVLAGEVLTKHALVKSVNIDDTEVSFTLRSNDSGKITSTGQLSYQSADSEYWEDYKKPTKGASKPATTRSIGGWDTLPSKNNLDDEIPF